jgi:hypothetical protein
MCNPYTWHHHHHDSYNYVEQLVCGTSYESLHNIPAECQHNSGHLKYISINISGHHENVTEWMQIEMWEWIRTYVGVCSCEEVHQCLIVGTKQIHWTLISPVCNWIKYERILPDKVNVQTSNLKLHCMENPRALSIVSISASW